ncbi:MAG: two-component regulator propeller domain-containing protein [Bacteroidales bacterium]
MLYSSDGHILLANERGILIFDGYQWELVPTPDIPTVLYALPRYNRVVVGGRNLLGWVERKTNGEYVFNSLKHDSIGIIAQIEAADSFVYFLTPHQIIVANNTLSQLRILSARPGKVFQLLIPFLDKMYVDDGSPLLSLITANGFKPQINFSIAGSVLYARPYDAKKLFLVTTDNRCYLFDGHNMVPFVIEDQVYLSQGAISQVMVVGTYIAFATNHGGCLVVNRSNGRTLHYINYQTGLPDDEIYCMTADSDGGIWLGHFYGLSRADFQLPVKNFSTYPGLQGRPQCMAMFQNTLFVGTNEGVFRLIRKASYQAVITPSVVKPVVSSTHHEEIKGTGKSETQIAAEAPVKKGLFARIFGKKKKQEEEKAEKPLVIEQNISVSTERKASAPKVTYRLASISYQYEKLQGIGKKCKQLVVFKDDIIAITTDELYRVQKDRAVSIARNIVVNAIYVDRARQCVYLATGEGIKKMTASYKLEDLISGKRDPVVSLTVIDNTLWAGMEKMILKVNLTRPNVVNKVIRLKGNEKYLLKNIQQTPFVFAVSGVYRIVNDSLQYFTGSRCS